MVAERKEKGLASQRPRIVLIEHISSNGTKDLMETTVMGKLDSSLKVYLKKESEALGVQKSELERSIQDVPKEKLYGKQKSKRKVRDQRKDLNQQLEKVIAYRKVLKQEGHNPLKITVQNNEAVGWEFAKGRDFKWVEFVRDKNPEILDELSKKELTVVYKTFDLRHLISLGRDEAKGKYFDFLDQVREGGLNERVYDWMAKVTKHFTKRG